MPRTTNNNNRSRGWCFTLNNYTPEEQQAIDNVECQYLVYGKEVGESGTPHLQGYIHFNTNVRMSQVKKALGTRAHIEVRQGSLKEAIDYCKKDGDVTERGKIRIGADNKWTDVIQLAEAGKMEEIKNDYPHLYLLHKQKLESLMAPNLEAFTDDPKNHFEWWVGPTGTGKSRTLWEKYGNNRYLKGITKWWDNYRYEEVVVIEEADPLRCQHMAHYFKIWCDHYPFRAEVKCSHLNNIRPNKIIITSNYTIRECFPNQQDYEPLERRFKVVKFGDQSLPPAFANGWNAPFDFDPNALGSLLEDL